LRLAEPPALTVGDKKLIELTDRAITPAYTDTKTARHKLLTLRVASILQQVAPVLYSPYRFAAMKPR